MKYINIAETNHEFEKRNLVTKYDQVGGYDLMKCKYCSLVGKRRGFVNVEILEKYSHKLFCKKAPIPVRVRVDLCGAYGRSFSNLVPNSEHDVIEPPEGYDSKRGVWVQGVGEPVMLLFGEFQTISYKPAFRTY